MADSNETTAGTQTQDYETFEEGDDWWCSLASHPNIEAFYRDLCVCDIPYTLLSLTPHSQSVGLQNLESITRK